MSNFIILKIVSHVYDTNSKQKEKSKQTKIDFPKSSINCFMYAPDNSFYLHTDGWMDSI